MKSLFVKKVAALALALMTTPVVAQVDLSQLVGLPAKQFSEACLGQYNLTINAIVGVMNDKTSIDQAYQAISSQTVMDRDTFAVVLAQVEEAKAAAPVQEREVVTIRKIHDMGAGIMAACYQTRLSTTPA